MSPSPHLPAIAVGGSAAADNNVNKITNAVTGDGPIVQNVNQLPPSELGGASSSNNSGGFPSISDVLDVLLPPGSLAGMIWQVVKADSPSEAIHGVLDLLGYIPVLGEAADLSSAAMYANEGDKLNAGISLGAAIPFFGWAAAAWRSGKQAVKGAENVAERAAHGFPVDPPCVGKNSFVAGTRVLMAGGLTKPIEEVELGDQVVATDPESGRTESRPVVATIIGEGRRTLFACRSARMVKSVSPTALSEPIGIHSGQ
ncbi:hypothetical protein [Amycolatopsis sp. WAC 01375]|uniref:hypothetical protein n=1 Tax=Amycolatopsis sp. WAC 01375 TaxID=2203194 RepID=UPI000F76E985|nr:hypothetical protein [Amycolatopsis sp. WAC 01375]